MSAADLPLAVTMGDPAGCGPAITIDVWNARESLGLAPFFVVGDPRLYRGAVPVQVIDRAEEAETVFAEALPVFDIQLDGIETLQPGTPHRVYATSIMESILVATQLALDGHAAGVVTNPISKAVLYDAGFEFAGHTEYIAHLCSLTHEAPFTPIMMLVGGGLRVALATIHIPLMQVADALTPDRLEETAKITHAAMERDFAITDPRIAFTGLNPHAGESGTIGREEIDLINPVAASLREAGLNISDARPGDTVFHEALNGQFDAVIAMTHDQGLIPVKTLDMWGGVNTTLGLPIIRTSPDHGTAYEAAAAGTCRSDSLIAALRLAQTLADNRANADG